MNNNVSTNKAQTKDTPRAVCYIRVARAQDHDSTAVEAQRQACERKARELGATIAEEYVDQGSGHSIEGRPALCAMLARFQSDGHISYLITYDHARLARSIEVHRKIVRALEAAGVGLVIVKEPGGPHFHKFMQALTAAMADLDAQHRREARRAKEVAS